MAAKAKITMIYLVVHVFICYTRVSVAACESDEIQKLSELLQLRESLDSQLLYESDESESLAEQERQSLMNTDEEKGDSQTLPVINQYKFLSQREKNNKLLDAAASGDMFMAKFLIQHKAQVNAKNVDGRPYISKTIADLVYSFVEYQHISHMPATKALYQKSAIILTGLKKVIHNQANYSASPLILAAFNGHIAMIDFLINKGAQRKAHYWKDPLFYAVYQGHYETVKYFLDQNLSENLLIGFGKKMFENQGEKYKNKQQYIIAAALQGHEDIVKLLLAYEIVQDVQRKILLPSFHVIAHVGRTDALKLLLDCEAIFLITQNERDKIRAIAAVFELPVSAIKIIASYKGLEEDKQVTDGFVWSKKMRTKTVDVMCSSVINKNFRGETAVESTQITLQYALDPVKQSALKECIALLRQQTVNVTNILVSQVFDDKRIV